MSYFDPARPTPVTLGGRQLVAWRHAAQGWVVQEDRCPHRLAPLSEGRLEAGGTRLACSYHGWEFDGSGKCTHIPQVRGGGGQIDPASSPIPWAPVRGLAARMVSPPAPVFPHPTGVCRCTLSTALVGCKRTMSIPPSTCEVMVPPCFGT